MNVRFRNKFGISSTKIFNSLLTLKMDRFNLEKIQRFLRHSGFYQTNFSYRLRLTKIKSDKRKPEKSPGGGGVEVGSSQVKPARKI